MKKKTKKKKLFIILLCIVLIVVGVFSCSSRKGEDVKYATIVVSPGDSAVKIASALEDNGIISNSPWFVVRLAVTGDRSKLKYGTFHLSSDMSYKEMVKVLSGGGIEAEVTNITIPEGYSIQQIADIIDKSEVNVTAEQFYDALDDDYNFEFLKNIPTSSYRDHKLQGFLFPSTYEFYIDTTAHDIIKTLLGEFDKQYKAAGGYESERSFYDVVVIASIIEREALLESELPTIAGVIDNRIAADMPLQVDATVVYAVTEGKYDITSVTYKDLEVKSHYNTYMYTGLPAGPISNPGAAAIKAALNPEKHDYLYYHTDETKQDGSHIFTTTFNEHQNTMN